MPTHAGKTARCRGYGRGLGAHPRSRGENTSPAGATGLSQGSSPLTRGKLAKTTEHLRRARLIPTHAGKTTRAATVTARRRAHPHSHGENSNRGEKVAGAFGSSPLTRGKRKAQAVAKDAGGLIPTHAGKTSPTQPGGRALRAHPHSRGENRGMRPSGHSSGG